ncbi:MAG: efflux RND transporter periplasmic adaptor subunit [Phenylobacterium sp.]|uniref:efflux RND transporter periplasmic adaptor subunit n=1 Tax=Phenylobacterium sp. TaxID=1871053 RepID=UPI00391C5496
MLRRLGLSAFGHSPHTSTSPIAGKPFSRMGFFCTENRAILWAMTDSMDRPVSRPKWWRSRRVLLKATAGLSTVALIAMAATMVLGARTTIRTPAASLTVDVVRNDVFRDFVTLRARVVPRDVVYLDALEGGQVEDVFVQAGDLVTAGQPLLRFRNTTLELEVLDREGRLVESITQLQTYEKQLEDTRLANEKAVARIQYDIVRLQRLAERRDALLAKGYVSRDQHDAVHDELAYNRRLLPLQMSANREQDELRRQQVPQIKAELESLRESLVITRSKLQSLVVRAPVAGRLTEMDLKTGEIRERGQRLGQITPNTGLKLQAEIDQYYLERIEVGQTGHVLISGRNTPFRVVRVDPQVKDSTFKIEMVFDEPQPTGLLPGQALEGRLTLGGDRAGLVLPAGPFLERSGGDWVMVLDNSGHRAERRRVRLGRRNAEQVEVLSGLAVGERVLTSDYASFEKVDQVILTK